MNRYYRYVLSLCISSIIAINIDIIDYLNVKTSIDLSTDQAITEYLPSRLRELVHRIKQNGIEQTTQELETDPDLDSFLFIIQAQAPHRLIAYSRNPTWYNQTPQQLHQLFKQKADVNVTAIFNPELVIAHLMLRNKHPPLRNKKRAYIQHRIRSDTPVADQ